MSASEHERLGNLFEQAIELAPAQREAFLAEACGDDAALRAELTSLLHAHETAGSYFESLSAQIVTPALSAMTRSAEAFTPAATEQLQESLAQQYRIERELGGAGMSRVFLAEEIRLKRRVVIKVLSPEMVPTFNAARFQREIELAAQLQHPHIVPLLTTGTANGTLYYTMPFVTGESLRNRLAREGPLPLDDALRIWRDLLDALAHAHAGGVIHCDIKPGNILLSGRNALVTDFGIALALETAGGDTHATTPRLAIGTPAYMAPEQIASGSAVDHRVDLYATGVVMYETLTGHPPFTAGSTRELLETQRTREPPRLARPDVPAKLGALVLSCLSQDPASRPQSAEELLAQLDASVASTDVVADKIPESRPARRLGRYAIALFALVAVLFAMTRLPRSPSAPVATDAAPSIAVLLLATSSGNATDSLLADGLTHELTSILGRNGNLRVVGTTSVQALHALELSVRDIANSLHLSHVLYGSAQRNGSRMRLQLRLLDVRNASTLWSNTYDDEMRNIYAMQDEVAREIARELGVQPAPGSRTAAGQSTESVEAWELYQRGMLDLRLGRGAAGRQSGIEYFKRAIAADPNFARAYAGLAHGYVRDSQSSLAEQAALKALALDSSLADAHSALGWARSAQRQRAAAQTELKKAIALDMNAMRAFEGLARLYMATGRYAEQLAMAETGFDVDPLSISAIRELALALSTNGKCDEALARLLPLRMMQPPAGVAGIIRGQCYAQKQMWPEAIREFRWAADSTDAPAALSMLGYALGRAGQREEATRILSDLLAGRKESNGAYGIGIVQAGLGNLDEAFASFEKAGNVRIYFFSPMFEHLRRDVRFNALKKHLNL